MVATIGFFDGVHEGHKFLLRQLVSEAKRRGQSAVVITFEEHPRRVLRKDYIPELLTTNSEKERLLHQIGVDKVVFLEFTEDFRNVTLTASRSTAKTDNLQQTTSQNKNKSPFNVFYHI
jgi:riboflavin kinase/FMN adenylyltransferase